MNDVIKFLNNKLAEDDKVIVACSGGSDSMGLLHLIMTNFNKSNVICAHVNHKVRKKSDREYKYVKNFCKSNGVVFEGVELNQKFERNFESEARSFRYDFFETLKDKYNAKYIITAHHGDDQIETILMRLTRGSTLSGYAGIKLEDGHYLRPFLYVTKNDILKYAYHNKIKYYVDYTNKLNIHTRNRYRHKILPFLKSEDAHIHKKYLKFSKELQDYDDFIHGYIEKKDLLKDGIVNLNLLKTEKDFIKCKVIEIYIKQIQAKDWLEVSDKNVESMLNIINSSKSNSMINLSNGYVAQKYYDKFKISKADAIKKYNDFECKFDSVYEDEEWLISKIEESNIKSNNVIRLSSDEIKLPLLVRNRREGDIINLKNNGRKKIKDLFIDCKVEISKRSRYPLVVDAAGAVLWVPGLKKSKFDKEKNEKYDIILLSERKEK